MENKSTWVISVAGYGSFLFDGNEEEAEGMRKHKAVWENGVSRKRIADSDEIQTKIINLCNNHPNYTNLNRYHCACSKCARNVKAS